MDAFIPKLQRIETLNFNKHNLIYLIHLKREKNYAI